MTATRRGVLKGGLSAAAAAVASAPVRAAVDAPPVVPPAGSGDRRDKLIWHDHPARVWQDAYPVGNGRLAGMVFGNARRERIQLNEDTLFAGGPYRNINPDAHEALPRVRALIVAGRIAEAETLAERSLQGRPWREMAYQSLGDLFLDLVDVEDAAVADYRRELDLDVAVARTRFTARGVRYRREVLCSAPDQVMAIRIEAEGGPLSLDCALASAQPGAVRVENGRTLALAGTNAAYLGNPGRLRFAARVEVVADGGSVTANGDTIAVRGARGVTLFLAAATSHRSPVDVSGDPEAIVAAQIAAATGKGLAAIRRDHEADYRRLSDRVLLQLPATDLADLPTDRRAARATRHGDPSLAALFFHWGRYLLISASRGSEPANLQGKWNESNRPPWESKYTININTEMNYWPADTANLPECLEPLVRMTEELAVSGAFTAREIYGARGWVAHHNTDLWRASGPCDHARTGVWPMGGAWLSNQLWDHWDFHRDTAYLRRIYPLLRGAALFFLDALVKDPGTGWMVTNPSMSPENNHGHGGLLCAGPTMDMQILRDLFDRTVASGAALGIDAPLRTELQAMRARLAPHRIGAQGQLQEWLEDWDADAPEQHHRHTSHLYGLFPSHQITLDDTPELARAARRSLELRGPEATGWILSWRTALWAHLREAEQAHDLLYRLLQTEDKYPGMLGVHPPFQIDCFFGGTAAIVEMLVQSRDTLIDLLPALPKAWPSGAIRGVRVRGGCTLDLAWADGAVRDVVFRPERSGNRTVRTGGRSHRIALEAGRPLRLGATAWG